MDVQLSGVGTDWSPPQPHVSTAGEGLGIGNGSAGQEHVTTERHWTSFPFYRATVYMWNVWLPAIFVLGTFGNVMTVVIMHRMASQEATINIYFTATAVSDLLYVLSLGGPEWLFCQFGVGLITAHSALYRLHSWLYTCCSTVSCWSLVCVTGHRAVSVLWPHRVNLLCTRRTVLLVVAAISVGVGLLYSHQVALLWNRPPVNDGYFLYCGKTSEDYVYFFENTFIYLDMLVYCLLPFLFLAVSNSVLVWKLNASVRAAGRHLAAGDSKQAQARERAANSVALTVVVVSMTFLVLTLPLSIHGIVDHVGTRTLGGYRGLELARVNFVHSLCTLLSLTNSSVNFYLYSLTGRRFRRECVKVLCCWRRRPPGEGSQRSTHLSQVSAVSHNTQV
ncbi:G-protein coupled receptor 15-like [Babylonia areolata]|uniref:G-protein coupled receptor 15-like n=1 Tax=Babylonia areolata TaxID=304850 RepID=UPI003FD03B32